MYKTGVKKTCEGGIQKIIRKKNFTLFSPSGIKYSLFSSRVYSEGGKQQTTVGCWEYVFSLQIGKHRHNCWKFIAVTQDA